MSRSNDDRFNESEAIHYKYVGSVRFRNSHKAYSFGTNNAGYQKDDHVVVETIRGLELGKLVSDLELQENRPVTLELKPIVRPASEQDIRNADQNKMDAKQAMLTCEDRIEQLGLKMKLVSCEYTLDKAKIIFVYVADERVDFRDLLKDLTQIFRCRIELRQIGQRDKAKMVGAIGICGQETCCSRYKNEFDVISINMAKTQMLALNTQKLSGQCGKLMCCLKYEDDMYKTCRKGLPKLNDSIQYKGQRYRVNSISCCSNSIRLYDGNGYVNIGLDEFRNDYKTKGNDKVNEYSA